SKVEYHIHHIIQRDDYRRYLSGCALAKNAANMKLSQIRYSGPASMIAAKPSVESKRSPASVSASLSTTNRTAMLITMRTRYRIWFSTAVACHGVPSPTQRNAT